MILYVLIGKGSLSFFSIFFLCLVGKYSSSSGAIFPSILVGARGNILTEPLQEEIFLDRAWRGRVHVLYRVDGPIRNSLFLIWAKGEGEVSPSRTPIFKNDREMKRRFEARAQYQRERIHVQAW